MAKRRRCGRRKQAAAPRAPSSAPTSGDVALGETCSCGGRTYPGHERCVHIGACDRRHGIASVILTLRFGRPYCGGCRVLLGDNPDEVSAESATARHHLEIDSGQLSMFAGPPADGDAS